jgi:excisionase family DNA binding protein
MENEPTLRPRDVAHLLDCCPDDLYPLIYTGEIKAQKVGRLWRFHLDDVMTYKNRLNGRPVKAEAHRKAKAEKRGA